MQHAGLAERPDNSLVKALGAGQDWSHGASRVA